MYFLKVTYQNIHDIQYFISVFRIKPIFKKNIKDGSYIYITSPNTDIVCLTERLFHHNTFVELNDVDLFFNYVSSKSKIKTFKTNSIYQENTLLNNESVKKGSNDFINGMYVSVHNNVVVVTNKKPIFENNVTFNEILACIEVSEKISSKKTKENESKQYFHHTDELLLFTCVNWETTNFDDVDFTKPMFLILDGKPYLSNNKPADYELITRYKAHEKMDTIEDFHSITLTLENKTNY